MKVLVTGGNGYLGACVVDALERAGHDLSVQNSHGENLLTHRTFHLREADGIVHLGWYARAGNGEPELQMDSLERTEKLLSQLRHHQFVVFASSAAVYGDREWKGSWGWRERDRPFPNCHYSRAKLCAEDGILSTCERPLIFRFGSLMGRGVGRTKTDLCVNAFALAAQRNEPIEVWNPLSLKPVLHVRDAAQLIRLGVEREWFDKPRLRILNAACGSHKAVSLAHFIKAVAQSESPVRAVPDRSGPRSCKLDTHLLQSVLPEMWEMRGVAETVREFDGYDPTREDLNRKWEGVGAVAEEER